MQWLQLKWRSLSRRRRRTVALLSAFLTLRIVVGLWPHAPLRDRCPVSTEVRDADGRLLRLTLASDDKYRLWVPLEEIAPTMTESTLQYEDRHFYRHWGWNPVSLVRATWQTISGTRRIGGSTVTMQLARRLYNIDSRSFSGKVEQIVRAMQLECQYEKRELLEAYLNLAPYGGNIEGVGAASLIYFSKPARNLILPEAMTLAVVPQSPTKRAPRAEGNAMLAAARQQLFDGWRASQSLSPSEIERMAALFRMPLKLHNASDLPFLAPHFVDHLLATHPTARRLDSTLSARLQRLVERQTQNYIQQKQRIGIDNAVAMLIDYRTMEVKAVVGSADYHNDAISGQVNGTLAKRSPGSALKPFIYALGMEQGVLHPETMLKDAPMAFAGYTPENFDGRFSGPLSARDALTRSRNIPALYIASRLGQPSFYQFLRTAGVAQLRSENHYGLSLVLGGAEVTMEELVRLYAALGNGGVLRPLKSTKDEADEKGVRILGEDSSFMVLDMLKDNPRPDRLPIADGNKMQVMWKTGTSYGFRDAWTVGLVGPYVLAVWVGNFSGRGNPAFVGVGAAAPLFFEIVDAIALDARGEERAQLQSVLSIPKRLRRVAVCAVSGQLPGAHCKHKKMTWFSPGHSPIQVCDIHREVVISQATGERTCEPFAGPVRKEVFEVWPSDMTQLFVQAGLPRRAPPPIEARCGHDGWDGAPPRITSPLRGVEYALQNPTKDLIAFNAVSDGDTDELYWFVNHNFVGRSKSGDAFYWHPTPGKFVVRVVDGRNRADHRELSVGMP